MSDPAPTADPFETADFYDAVQPFDRERISCKSPAAAIEEFLDPEIDNLSGTETVRDAIARLCPITVRGWRRSKISELWVRSVAARAIDGLIEGLQEEFNEEYGDYDGGADDFPETALVEVRAKLAVVIRELLLQGVVFHCEECSERVYTSEQVLAMMLARRSDWFGVEAGAVRSNGFFYTGKRASDEQEKSMREAFSVPIIVVGRHGPPQPQRLIHEYALAAGLPEIRGFYGYDFEAHEFIREADADQGEPDAWPG